MHPSEDLFWSGDFVVEFSSGKILTEVNRKGLTELSRIYEDPLKVDWIGSDRVVEIVILQSSGEREEKEPQLRALRLWNTKTGGPVVTTEAIHAVAVSTSPEGAWIAEAGDNKRLRLRHSETLLVERDIRVHDKALTSVAWHPTLPLIVTTAVTGHFKVYHPRSNQNVPPRDGSFLGLAGCFWQGLVGCF
jgi:WD40 repeat protein